MTDTKEPDYLDQDLPLRGQNYSVVSFLSPEKVLVRSVPSSHAQYDEIEEVVDYFESIVNFSTSTSLPNQTSRLKNRCHLCLLNFNPIILKNFPYCSSYFYFHHQHH